MIALIFVAALMTAQPSSDVAPVGNGDEPTDATCAKATDMAAAMTREAAQDNLVFVNAFYVGRVSGRSGDRTWRATVEREADKGLNDTNAGTISVRCQKRMRAIITAR